MDHQKSESVIDFLQGLETDTFVYIMNLLDDPADLARASAVSRYWREFVIANKLAKQLCVKTFPQFSEIVDIVDTSRGDTNSVGIKTEDASGWEILKRDHKVYASIHQAITKSRAPIKDCIEYFDSAVNNLRPRDQFIRLASFWSSIGQSDPSVPETLVYKLRAGIWVITKICIRPLQGPLEDFFQFVKSVRFRLGHLRPLSKSGCELHNLPLYETADVMFQWTYTSPEFPMMQENCLQEFQLPEPVLCIDGYLQIELSGTVQGQEMHPLSLIMVCYLWVLGRSLFPAFDMEVLEPYGFMELVLKHDLEKLAGLLKSSSS